MSSKIKSSSEKILSKSIYNSIIEDEQDSTNTKNFKRLINLYMNNITKFLENQIPEFEIRFGTKKIKQITKIDFQNVVKSINNYGFKLNNEEYYLKIINDGEFSNIRTIVKNISNIQNYCKYNNLNSFTNEESLEFVVKEYFKTKEDKTLYPLDFDEYNFRICFQIENKYNKTNKDVQELINKWSSQKKIFRYIKRFEFKHPLMPIIIHCSIVKTSKSHNNKFVSHYNIKDSEIFSNLENYEIEI